VGRLPRAALGALARLLVSEQDPETDEGVGCGTGVPPHKTTSEADKRVKNSVEPEINSCKLLFWKIERLAVELLLCVACGGVQHDY